MAGRGFSLAVGFVLALLFAGAMGLSSAAILVTEYMQPGRATTEQARQTLVLCAVAGGLAALLAWLLQMFAAERPLVVRFVYGFLAYALSFGALGGLLLVAKNMFLNPGTFDVSLSGLYGASVGSFYTFAIFILVPLRPALFGLLIGAGLILAIVGPNRRGRRRPS